MADPVILLTPLNIARLLDPLTDAEVEQLRQYVGPEPDPANTDDYIRFCSRTSEWLLSRFPEYLNG